MEVSTLRLTIAAIPSFEIAPIADQQAFRLELFHKAEAIGSRPSLPDARCRHAELPTYPGDPDGNAHAVKISAK